MASLRLTSSPYHSIFLTALDHSSAHIKERPLFAGDQIHAYENMNLNLRLRLGSDFKSVARSNFCSRHSCFNQHACPIRRRFQDVFVVVVTIISFFNDLTPARVRISELKP